MEHLKAAPPKFLSLALLLGLFLWILPVRAEAPSEKARTAPLEQAVRLAAAGEPLSLASFIESALLFSGIVEASLEGEKAEVYALISQAAAVIDRSQEARRLAEEILQFMHEQVLTVYREEQTRLDVLLKKGSFNCVSSAILYSILAKSMGLKVWGIRAKDHAFCRVQAGDQAFDVETTSPFGFDPGSRKEFTDHFGMVTGYTYVSPTNYRDRLDTGERGLLSLILYNRQAFLSERREYVQAVGPAVDAYAMLKDEESYERLIVSLSNLGSWYGIKRRYQEAMEFLGKALEDYNEPRLSKLRQDLFHNWVIELINKSRLDEALSLMDARFENGEVEEEEWKKLTVYAYQVKAQGLAREDFEQAALLIREALDKIGRDPGLLRSYEVYNHNQVVRLLNSSLYEDARRVLDSALTVLPDSVLLRKDQRLIDSRLETQ